MSAMIVILTTALWHFGGLRWVARVGVLCWKAWCYPLVESAKRVSQFCTLTKIRPLKIG